MFTAASSKSQSQALEVHWDLKDLLHSTHGKPCNIANAVEVNPLIFLLLRQTHDVPVSACKFYPSIYAAISA